MICKREQFVGSRIPGKICKTAAEWEIGRQNAQDALDQRGRGNDYTYIRRGPQ